MKKFPLTIFKDVFAKTKVEREVTFDGLAKLISKTSAATKEKLPLLKLAMFGTKRSDKGSLREDDNVLAISGIELDYDGKEIPFAEAVATLESNGLTAVVYTTPSHTPAKPRWRVLMPTSEPLSPDQRAKLVARVNGIFDGRLAKESFTLSLSVYYGHAKANPKFEFAVVHNEFVCDCIDERDDLDEGAIGKPDHGERPAVDPQIDWAKVEDFAGWCKSAESLPDHFQAKGKDIVAFKGTSIRALNEQLAKIHDRHTAYGSWNSVTFALATMAKQANLPTEQIAALLRCDLPCNQHVLKFESDRDQQRAITRAIMRSRNPVLVLSRGSPLESARAYVARSKAPLLFHADVFYEWQGTHYQAMTDNEVNGRLYAFLDLAKREYKEGRVIKQGPFNPARDDIEKLKHALKAVVTIAEHLAPPVWLKGSGPGMLVACENGLLNLADGDLLEHTADYFNTSALSFPYEPDAKPAAFVKFLNSVWPDDQQSIDTLQEMFGYILSGDRTHQKIFMLVGPKRAGKSTIGQLLHKLVGPNGSTGSSLLSLSTRFGLQPLINKSLVVMPDERIEGGIRSPHVTTALLKVSGGDIVTVDRKLIAQWTGRIPVCFVIITNEVPALRDNSGALAARFIVLQFKQSFLGSDQDKGLLDKLQAELPGILNWSIDGWRRLEVNEEFIQPESGKASARLLGDMGSPISAFVDERCKVGVDFKVPTAKLFEAYCEWADGAGYEDINRNALAFGRDLQSALPDIAREKAGPRKARAWHYIGVKLA